MGAEKRRKAASAGDTRPWDRRVPWGPGRSRRQRAGGPSRGARRRRRHRTPRNQAMSPPPATRPSSGPWPTRSTARWTPPSTSTSCSASSSSSTSPTLSRSATPRCSPNGAGEAAEDRDEYTAENIFRVPPEARWAHLKAQARQAAVGRLVDDAMAAIERDNPALRDVLPRDYARPALDKQRLGQLIDLIVESTDWRGGVRSVGVAVSRRLSQYRCLTPRHRSVSSRRSSNRMRISRIRLSDEIMPSPTESSSFAPQGESGPFHSTGACPGSAHTPRLVPCACDTATDAAAGSRAGQSRRKPGLPVPSGSSSPIRS